MTSAGELCAMITAPQANYELVQEYYGKYIYIIATLFCFPVELCVLIR